MGVNLINVIPLSEHFRSNTVSVGAGTSTWRKIFNVFLCVRNGNGKKTLPRRTAAPVHPWITVLLLVGLAVAGCNIFGSDDTGLPGKQVLANLEFADWTWLPNEQEILYSTPFDYPYTGPPTRLETVGVSGRGRRTVVAAPADGNRIIPFRFKVQGSHVYFEMELATDKVAFYRASLNGASGPEMVLDSIPGGVLSVSPDERMVAWVDGGTHPPSVVTADIATGVRHLYPLPEDGHRVIWSPSGRSVVVEYDGWVTDGTPFQWLDLESGSVQVWLAPTHQDMGDISTRHYRWLEETPFLYTSGYASVERYSLETGTGEWLAKTEGGSAIGWSPDFETVFLSRNQCINISSGGPFGSGCLKWENRADRLIWRSGQKTNIYQHQDIGTLTGRPSRKGTWFAYEYSSCGPGCYTEGGGDGLYVMSAY